MNVNPSVAASLLRLYRGIAKRRSSNGAPIAVEFQRLVDGVDVDKRIGGNFRDDGEEALGPNCPRDSVGIENTFGDFMIFPTTTTITTHT